MNIFYARPRQIQNSRIELRGQEAAHASKSLRYVRGDAITVVDGAGGWYEGLVQQITDESVLITVEEYQKNKQEQPKISLGMGIIKKHDRLEFAVEKAVELGVKEVILFRGDHSVKQNIRRDRLQNIAISAMKQSLQAWLPNVSFISNVEQITATFSARQIIVGRRGEKTPPKKILKKSGRGTLLMAGPEGGFSDRELHILTEAGSIFLSINNNRLRAETAVVALLSLYHGL